MVTKDKSNPQKQSWKEQAVAGEMKTISLSEVKSTEEKRLFTQDAELNRASDGESSSKVKGLEFLPTLCTY